MFQQLQQEGKLRPIFDEVEQNQVDEILKSDKVCDCPLCEILEQEENGKKKCCRGKGQCNNAGFRTLLLFSNDAPRALQLGFQDPATSHMEGIIALHQSLSIFLLGTIILVA
jgi:hypothetical protein